MIILTQEEYQYWIDEVKKTYPNLPDGLINDMLNWRNRSTLARFLIILGKNVPAIELFKSVLDIEVHEEEDCVSLSEVEDKVWCLKDLAIVLWHTTGKREEGIQYLEEAKALIMAYPGQFDFLKKDEEWDEIQNFMIFTSKEAIIEENKAINHVI
jgi:tetratricopeptide (TPR) repeat protein